MRRACCCCSSRIIKSRRPSIVLGGCVVRRGPAEYHRPSAAVAAAAAAAGAPFTTVAAAAATETATATRYSGCHRTAWNPKLLHPPPRWMFSRDARNGPKQHYHGANREGGSRSNKYLNGLQEQEQHQQQQHQQYPPLAAPWGTDSSLRQYEDEQVLSMNTKATATNPTAAAAGAMERSIRTVEKQQPQAQEDLHLNSNATATGQQSVEGTVLDHAVDLRHVRAGDRLNIPYQVTVSETWQDFWFASFFDQNRIHCSTPFCRSMGLQDRVLPFSLALFLASSMSHADAAKVQVGFGKVSYVWPIFAGDTLSKHFTVTRVRNTSASSSDSLQQQQQSVIHFSCDLINQRGRLCMRADKRMLFPFAVSSSSSTTTTTSNTAETTTTTTSPGHDDNANMQDQQQQHLFRDHLLSKATTVLAEQPSHSLAKLSPGLLILHTLHRSLTLTQSQQLASLARLTHERHYDTYTFQHVDSEIYIPGGLVLGITLSAAARDLYEILHEEVVHCTFLHPLHPTNVVGAISYIHAVDENLPGDLELVSVTTLGLKNVHVKRELEQVRIPLELFQAGLYRKDIEKICREQCPVLQGKIVASVERRILRQTSHREVFLL